MSRIHHLKVLPEYFRAVVDGAKPFEARKDDRGFGVGDTLILREWADEQYTGRVARAAVTYILRGGAFGIEHGYVVMGIRLATSLIKELTDVQADLVDAINEAGLSEKEFSLDDLNAANGHRPFSQITISALSARGVLIPAGNGRYWLEQSYKTIPGGLDEINVL